MFISSSAHCFHPFFSHHSLQPFTPGQAEHHTNLRVEEPSHPERRRPTLKDPRIELGVTIQQVREPEA